MDTQADTQVDRPVDPQADTQVDAQVDAQADKPVDKYDPAGIEPRWQARWAEDGVDRTPARPTFYALEFFPYPSGEGLSVGHVRNYVIGDVVARYKRMQGYDVLHPMGWDAFGLPAENEARKHGRHPADTTRRYAANYRRQMNLVGVGYDWSREIFSSDPDYYRWTQWLFLLLHERGLAYRGSSRQWWCAECETVLANEQVSQSPSGPVCWRGHRTVARRAVAQWFLRITDYADRLLTDLDDLDWPDGILAMQRHWIGRSEGVEIDFVVERSLEPIQTFTTRPDTLFGVTALVVAPEHPAVAWLARPTQQPAVAAYVAAAERLSEMDRRSDEMPKTGVFTGSHAVHPLTGEPLQIWVADYVLPDYGSGAVMLVPAHDDRDGAFAATVGLPSRQVVRPGDGAASPGVLVDSGRFSGLSTEVGGRAIADELAGRGAGRRTTTYRMRDWSIGRQRYWGAPIPIIHCPDCGVQPVPDCDLPVVLPQVADVPPPGVDEAGQPVSPLAAISDFVTVSCPACGGEARRETDTLDGFACSSWYFLRFANPWYADGPFDAEAVERWLPVDLYVGGAEHAVMHLLYARFWTKVLHDAGLVSFDEPFPRLRNQGMILDATGAKMAKSRPEHLVTPDAAVAAHGADALRAFELFIAPFDQDVAWSEGGLAGVSRWLRRVWRVAQGDAESVSPLAQDLRRKTHMAIRDVTEAMEGFRFNVAVARLMAFTNDLVDARNAAEQDKSRAAARDDGPLAGRADAVRQADRTDPARTAGRPDTSRQADGTDPACAAGRADTARQAGGSDEPRQVAWDEAVDGLLRMLAPIAPHIAEELWARRGRAYSIHQQTWPELDAEAIAEDTFELVVQVDGKVRDRLVVPVTVTEDEATAAALSSRAVERALGGAEPSRVIYVAGRLVNIVV